MMNIYKISKKDESSQVERVRSFILDHPFTTKLFEIYDINKEQFQKVKIGFKDMDFLAISNSRVLLVNSKFLDKELEEYGHVIVHELSHWLTRMREKEMYFTDPEEIEAFSYGMAYEMSRGKDTDEIFNTYYPVIRKHFENDKNANAVFKKLLISAKKRTIQF
jgi:hypothetical protein